MEKQEIVLEATEEKNQEKEIKSRRRPNEKHFRRADGTYEARLFSQPVHYYDEATDSYEEYHPSFEEKEAEYVAENGSFRVKFGKNMSQEKAIEVSRGGSKVSWHALHWKNDRAPETNVDQFTEAEDVPESAVAKYTAGEEELLYEAGRNYVKRKSIDIRFCCRLKAYILKRSPERKEFSCIKLWRIPKKKQRYLQFPNRICVMRRGYAAMRYGMNCVKLTKESIFCKLLPTRHGSTQNGG